MKPAATYQMPEAERNLLSNLRLSDEETNGCPVLPGEQRELAQQWLSQLLIEAPPLLAHTEMLERCYCTRFHPPLPRGWTEGRPIVWADAAAGFRHNQLLPEEETQALANNGPGDYPSDKLARLLLNPLALWDLADLISYRPQDYWLPRMEQAGRELIEREGLHIPIPGLDEPR